MFTKVISTALVLGSFTGALNASSALNEEQQNNTQTAGTVSASVSLNPSLVDPTQGYFLRIVSPCDAINLVANTAEAIGFGVHLKKSDGTYPQGWHARLITIRKGKRSEGFPVVVAGQKKDTLVQVDASQRSAVGDNIMVCHDGLSPGQLLTCEKLLQIPLTILTKPENHIPGFLFFADQIAKPN